MAFSDCSWQAVWIKSLLNELDIDVGPIHINGDNQGSLFIRSNPVQEKQSKHIDIRYHFIRQCVEEKKISLYCVKGAENPADMFTKNLGKVKFLKFQSQLGLEFYVARPWVTYCILGDALASGSVEQTLNKHSSIRHAHVIIITWHHRMWSRPWKGLEYCRTTCLMHICYGLYT